jgi:hypothetical protein
MRHSLLKRLKAGSTGDVFVGDHPNQRLKLEDDRQRYKIRTGAGIYQISEKAFKKN